MCWPSPSTAGTRRGARCRARRKERDERVRRVPEKTLFLLAILGGSVGAILGMRVWHHKTRHWYFKYGLPAILLAQLALAWYLGGLH